MENVDDLAKFFACIQYAEDKLKYYYVLVTTVFYKSSDKVHIKPKNLFDFDQKNKYYISWKNADDLETTKRYPGHIICLGVSEEDAKNRATKKPKRFIFEKKFSSTDSTECEDESVQIPKPPKLSLCKIVNEKDNRDRILRKYKEQFLIKNRKILNLDLNKCSDNESHAKKNIIDKNLRIKLLDLKYTNKLEKYKFLKQQRARKTFPNKIDFSKFPTRFKQSQSSTMILQSVQQSALESYSPRYQTPSPNIYQSTGQVNNDISDDSPELSAASESTPIRLCKRQNKSGKSIRFIPQSRMSVSPNRSPSVRLTPLSLIASPAISVRAEITASANFAQITSRDELENDIQNLRETHIPEETENEVLNSPQMQIQEAENDVQNSSQLNRREQDENEGVDAVKVCQHLYEYKYKMYQMYKKRGFDLTSEIEEQHERYTNRENKVYLGCNVRVGEKTWRIAKSQKNYTTFLRYLGRIIWPRGTLAHRCLDARKLKKVTLPNSVPIQLCSPRKVDLFLSVFEDYLKNHKRYENMTDDARDLLIMNSTETLIALIRDRYLGEGIAVPINKWEVIQLREKPSLFLNDLIFCVWERGHLCNRGLDLSREVKNIPGRSPVKLIEPEKLRLLISVYADFLEHHKNLSSAGIIKELLKVTYILRHKIYKLRNEQILAQGNLEKKSSVTFTL